MGVGEAYLIFSWTFIPVIVALVECFIIQQRTRRNNDAIKSVILQKAAVIFSEPTAAFAGS